VEQYLRMASPVAANLLSKLRIPVIGAPLFIVSNPKLVVAQCSAGIVGSFPALNARPKEKLDDWLREIKTRLADVEGAAPFAVNQIVHKSNNRLMQDMELVVKHEVPVVITSLGAREDINAAVHSYGGIVLHDVINNFFARKAIEKGADGLIAVAAGAGGHAGKASPFAMMQELRSWYNGPIALSGSIASGRAVLSAQAMGADFAYVGSAFIATHEANATDPYKQAVVDGNSESIVNSSLFTGVHGNYLRSSIVNAGLDPDNLPEGDVTKMNFGQGDGQKDVSKAWRDIWGCGQGIGAINAVEGAGAVVDRFAREYADASSQLTAATAAMKATNSMKPRPQ